MKRFLKAIEEGGGKKNVERVIYRKDHLLGDVPHITIEFKDGLFFTGVCRDVDSAKVVLDGLRELMCFEIHSLVQ